MGMWSICERTRVAHTPLQPRFTIDRPVFYSVPSAGNHMVRPGLFLQPQPSSVPSIEHHEADFQELLRVQQ